MGGGAEVGRGGEVGLGVEVGAGGGAHWESLLHSFKLLVQLGGLSTVIHFLPLHTLQGAFTAA